VLNLLFAKMRFGEWMHCGLAMNLGFSVALGIEKGCPPKKNRWPFRPEFFGTERACTDSIGIIADNEQRWPGRAILEYDSWIQACEGCGPNLDFF
jgi:hypothetical protein